VTLVSADGTVTRTGDRALITFIRPMALSTEEVWNALTDPVLVSQWLAPASIDPRVGGQVDIDFAAGGHVTGTILIIDPPRTLEHEWHFEGEAASIVRHDLAPERAGTRLTLAHRDLGAAFAGGCAPGWHAYLDRLGALLDGTDLPDWDARFAAVRTAYG
jgi:uncharacterized protein YndB with AHSA1/START domain